MEPIHIYALLQLKNAEEARRHRFEHDVVAREHARTARRQRIRRLRPRFIGRSTRPATIELAVR